MENFYKNTIACLNKYNKTIWQIQNFAVETTDDQDEFLTNFCVYLAHALIRDTGEGQLARKELCRVADIIKTVCEEE